MCIALLSTAHPNYPFILLNNRDEFLNRPTLPADWWDAPNGHVLAGRDTQRQERGTWLGITKQGRVATLTNFREEGIEVTREKSRGAIINAWLTGTDGSEGREEFAERLIRDVGINDVGGFSLLFGELRAPDSEGRMPGLSVLSNRSASAEHLKLIASTAGETHGLSNSHFGDTTWPKVVHGEKLLSQAIQANISRGGADSKAKFIDSLLDILSIDMLRQREPGEDWDVYVRQMRNSILIPPVKGTAGVAAPNEGKNKDDLKARVDGTATPDHGTKLPSNGADAGAGYGTQKQTAVLVDRGGHVTFVERTLYDEQGRRLNDEKARRVLEFDIEGWE